MPLNQIMKDFADSVGFKSDKEVAYGMFNGFFVTVYNTSYNKAAFVNFAKPSVVFSPAVKAGAKTDENGDDAGDAAIGDEYDENVDETAEGVEYDADETDGSALSDNGDPEEDDDGYDDYDESDESGDGIKDFEFANEFQALAVKYDVKEHEIDENGVYFETPASLVRFRELLEQTIELLKKHGYAGNTHCSSCGKAFDGNDACRVFRDRFNYLVCTDCADELLEEQERENEQTALALSGGSTGKAVGFSLLASLCLSALMVILYKYFLPAVPVWGDMQPGFIACLVPLAMAAVNMVVYRNTAKKTGFQRIAASLAIALVFTVCTQYICSVIQFVRSGAATLAEAKAGVHPLTATQLSNAATQILKMPIVRDTEWYMFYKYLIVDVCAVFIGIIGLSFYTLPKPEKQLTVIRLENNTEI